MTFCCGGAAGATGIVLVSGIVASGSSSESSESLESLFAADIPPKRAAAALAFFLSAFVSYFAAFEGLEFVVVAELAPPIALLWPRADELGALVLAEVSGTLTSSYTGVAPQTFLTPDVAKEALGAPDSPGFTPVTLKGAASPVFVAAAAPPWLARMSGFDCCKDCECFVTPIVAAW